MEDLSYDPLTGHITRRGKRAGTVVTNGYRQVTVQGKRYMEHRLAWYLYYGKWPEQTLDHINGIRTDNRICNLRDVSMRENVLNHQHPRKRSGLPKGVFLSKDGKRYRAQAYKNGKRTYLGTFDSPEQAHQTYLEAIS
jgi:hypothetical protein